MGLAGFCTDTIVIDRSTLFFRWLLALVKYAVTTLHFGSEHCIRNVLFLLHNNDRPL